MKTYSFRSLAFLFTSLFTTLLFSPSAQAANPVGESVAAGSVSFDRITPGVLSIRQDTDRAIINWQDFSIGAGDLTRFIQPGANSAALNRVLGGNPSAIYGTLQANGQVILLNPAGILVGSGGRVDTRGFIASTLNLSDESFLSKAKLSLAGNSDASVKNAGTILGGNVYLIARSVDNAGSISGGNVGLVGASEVILGDADQGVAVLYGSGSVNNSGLIEAASAELRAAGGNVYALAINNSGVVRANTVANEGGKIVLKADGAVISSGTLDASGSKGGEVQVLGSLVGLDGSSVVDVSGVNGAGTALIGGDFQGKNPSILNAVRTIVGPNAAIRADSTLGNGGKVIIWSDDLTAFSGSISAKGGKGGFAEISGKMSLGFDGRVDVGQGGTTLLDPRDLTIAATGTFDATALLADGLLAFADVGTSTASHDITISAAAITGLTGNVELQAYQDLTINAALTLDNQTAGETVIFKAGDDLTINAAVNTAGASLEFFASHTGGANTSSAILTVAAPVGDANTGNITFNNLGGGGTGGVDAIKLGENVTSGGNIAFDQIVKATGNPTVTGVNATFTLAVNSDATANNRQLTVNASGATAFNSTVGATTALGSLTTDSSGTAAGTTTLAGSVSTTGAQTYNDPVTIGASLSLVSSSSGNIVLNSAVAGTTGTALTVNTAGISKFGGAVGTVANPLASVTTDAAGTTSLDGGAVFTLGAQTYSDEVVIGADTSLTTTAANTTSTVTFGKTVNADLAGNNRVLYLNAKTNVTFSGIVGGNQRLGTLTTVDQFGTTIISSSGVSSKIQTYNEVVRLGASTTLTGETITLNGTVNATAANSQGLTINGSGATTIAGVVGGSFSLAGLTTDAAGSTTISAAGVTASAQAYNDPVTIANTLTLVSASTIALNNTVNADLVDERELTINAAGTTTIGDGTGTDTVGGLVVFRALKNTAAAGTTAFGSSATTVNATTITLLDAVTFAADSTLVASTVNLTGTVNGAAAGVDLVINASADGTISGVVGATTPLASLTTDASGRTLLGGSVTTSGASGSGDQTYKDVVILTGSSTLTAIVAVGTRNVRFERRIDATTAGVLGGLTVNSTGTTTITSPVGAGADGIHGNADDKGLLTLAVSSTSGTLALNGGVVRAATQTYSGPVVLGANTTLGGTTLTVAGAATTVTFGASATVDSDATARSLTVNATTTAFGAAVGTTALSSLTTDSTGTTTLRSVTTTGSQTYNDPLTLGAAATLRSTTSGSITIGSTLGGAFALDVRTEGATPGTTTFGGAVSGLTSIVTDAGGTTSVATTSVSTTGAQTYGDAVTIGANTTATTTHTFASTGAASAITFSGTVNGANINKSLVVNDGGAAGIVTFTGVVGGTQPPASITTDNGSLADTTVITANVTTSGAQTYNDDLRLAGGVTLTSTASGNIAFAQTLQSNTSERNLTVNTGGTTTFTGAVGGAGILALDALTTDSAGTTVINGGSVQTIGAQTFNDAVTLGAGTTITATADAITFGSTLNGAQTLVINNGNAATTFGGAVGGSAQLTSFATDNAGTTVINTGTFRATTQTFSEVVSLGVNTTLTATTLTVTAGTGSISADAAANNRTLTINATSTTLNGAIGTVAGVALGALTTDNGASHITTLGGITIRATTVNLNDPVALTGGGTTIIGTDVNLALAVTGAQPLTVTASGLTTFGAAVGVLATPLTSLTTDGGGSTRLANNVFATTQTYSGAVTLAGSLSLSGATGVSFASTVNADLAANNRALHVTSAGGTTFTGAVGGSEPLSLVQTTAATAINGGTVRAATQTYGGTTTIDEDTVLVGTTITLATITGGAFNLTVSATDVTTVGGAISGIKELTFDNGGSVAIGADITTTGKQTYGDSVTLSLGSAATTTLNATTADIVFNSTINGNPNLIVNTSGAKTFAGAVGGTTALESIVTGDGSTLTISGGTMKTDVGQSYADTITLGGNTLIQGTTLTGIAALVTGNGYDLTLSLSGATTLGGATALISGVRNLTSDTGAGVTTIAGNITTTGRQNYVDPISLAPDVAYTLAASDINFSGALTESAAITSLTLTASGATTLAAVTLSGNLTSNGGGVTQLNGNVAIANSITVTDTLVLGGNTVLTAGTLTAASIVGGGTSAGTGSDLTLTVSGNTTLTGAIVGVNDLTFTAAGATVLNGGTISTTGTQAYNDGTTLGAATTLASSGVAAAGNITFSAAGTISAGVNALTINTGGATSLGGAVVAGSIATDAAGTTSLGANVTTSEPGGQVYGDNVSLAAGVTLTTSNDAVTFNGTLSGTQDLSIVNGTAAVTFGNLDGVDTVGTLANLTVSGSGTVTINAGAITTSANLSFAGPVTLGAHTTLTGVVPTFGGAISGGGTKNLELTFSGNTVLNGTTLPVGSIQNLSVLNVAGATSLTGIISTTGTQSYTDNMTLSGDTVLTSTGAGALGNITFNGTVNGTANDTEALTVNTDGTTTFANTVGGAFRLENLVTDANGGSDAGEKTILNASVTTGGAGGQTFGDAVVLSITGATPIVLTTFADPIAFNSTIDGDENLNVDSTGGTIAFGNGAGDAVGGTTALTSLTTTGAGVVTITGGSIRTSVNQTYGGNVMLGADTVLTGATLSIGSVNVYSTGANRDLALNFTGTTVVVDATFADPVTGVTQIKNLSFGSGGTTSVIGTIGTTGTQTYNSPVTLAGATVLTSDAVGAPGSITFGSTINNTQTLAVNSDGTTTFNGAVGMGTALTSLATDNGSSADTTVLNADVKTTGATGAIVFGDALSLGNNVTLTGSHATITSTAIGLAAVSGGGYTLNLNTTGGARTVIAGAISGVNNLVTDTGGANGETRIGANVTTIGNQTYTDAVILTEGTTLAGATPTFSSTVTGGNNALTLNFSGTHTITGGTGAGGFEAVGALTTGGGGITQLIGIDNTTDIATTGAQVYNDAVQLTGNTTLTATALNVTFNSTVDSSSSTVRELNVVNTTGTTTFAGAVGLSYALSTLTIDASAGSTVITGGNITTTGAQTYGDAITIGANTTLTAGAASTFVSFTGNDAVDLTLNFVGTTTVADPTFVQTPGSRIRNLAFGNGGTTDLSGTTETTGTQTFNEAVTIATGQAITIASTASGSAGNITFAGTVNGFASNTESLTVNTTGTTTFGGPVGNTQGLAALVTNAGGGTSIGGGSVKANDQTYADTVTLTVGTVFLGIDNTGDHLFNATTAILGNGNSLTLSGQGITRLAGNVSGVSNLTSDGGGTTQFGATGSGTGVTVTTTGFQVYVDNIILNRDATLTGSSVDRLGTSAIEADGGDTEVLIINGSTIPVP